MKSYFLLLSVLLLTGCNLDLQPENGLTYSNSFNTEAELNATTSSIHFYLSSAISENEAFQVAGLMADELSNGQQTREWNPQTVKELQDWGTLYNVVFESNLLLDNIHRTKNLTTERRNFHVGQARFALGLAYLALVQRYGDVPVLIDSKTIKAYATSPQLDVLNTAISHAEQALALLPTYDKLTDLRGAPIASRQYASKGSCAALLAHLYAWKGSVIERYKLDGDAREAYRKSMEYSTMLIEQKVGNYALSSTPDALCEALSQPRVGHPEIVFCLTYDINRSNYVVTPNVVATRYTSWPVDETKQLGDLLESTDLRLHKSTVNALYESADLRRTAFFYQPDDLQEVDGTDYALMYKFRKGVYDADQYAPSGKVFRSLDADYVYWRLADFYLLRAECAAKLGQDAQAIDDLNAIRRRANATDYPAAGDTEGLAKAIFREREKEFIGENDARYFDIVRNNYIATELTGKFRQLTQKDIANGALVLPVPRNARLDKNGNLINTVIRQKPYWAQFM